MYACADIVYGWDLSGADDTPIAFKNASGEINRIEFLELLENEEPEGYLSFYSGAGGDPHAIGISIDGFNSFGNFLTKEIPHEVTEKQKKELNKLVANMSDEVKEYLNKMGEPQLFVLWSTS